MVRMDMDKILHRLSQIPIQNMRVIHHEITVESPNMRPRETVTLEIPFGQSNSPLEDEHRHILYGKGSNNLKDLHRYNFIKGDKMSSRDCRIHTDNYKTQLEALVRISNRGKTPKKQIPEYEFLVQNLEMMNFDEIEPACTKENPILCITASKYRFVIVHRSILMKANLLQIKSLKMWKQKAMSNASMVFELLPIEHEGLVDIKNVEGEVVGTKPELKITPRTFKRSLSWVRKVLNAPWGNIKEPINVIVQIPNL